MKAWRYRPISIALTHSQFLPETPVSSLPYPLPCTPEIPGFELPRPNKPVCDTVDCKMPPGRLLPPLHLFGPAPPIQIDLNQPASFPAGTDKAAVQAIADQAPFGGLTRALVTDPSHQAFGRLVQAFYPDARLLGEQNGVLRFARKDGHQYEARMQTNGMGIVLYATHLEIRPAGKSESAPQAKASHYDLRWDYSQGGSLEKALQEVLPGASLGKPYGQHPFTHYDVTTPNGDTWKITWLTGGIVATSSASLERQ